ncbi:glucan biosynthesis protein [Pseudooctadecabacter jejudonensis]|uniref:Glucans biosynthesis protein G n=1 Tax=Pseudooctadecabacter jejudonensis TaxID=1391910 RepID=A0A1Y5SMC5_9RHOB|nr:glucan biosynthesis protein G [Pseudooctadecabacter jejudonensis]SLN44076.1 Glucans biosynthesis protein G precursor [Pseudooctadecabacter jejudonensis]
MLRREFLASLAALAAAPALGQSSGGLRLAEGAPFDPDDVIALARNLAARAYVPPVTVPAEWTEITYEDYVSIWFADRNALWNGEAETPLRLDVFAPGLYFPTPISLSVVEGGKARPLPFDLGVFDKTDKFPDLPVDETLGYSGLRLRAELEHAGIYQEFAVFQGASYFRAIGTGNIYGLSARGLAIDTAEPSGEEFPDFRAFWLEKPAAGQTTFVLHALLDSPSCTGAYRFEITPGPSQVMEITARIFPRLDMDHVGLAPLTSMFQYDQTNRHRFDDFRPAVHDNDGLQIVNGAGETIWRPLANPKTLQISAFVDDNPRGFGLRQRAQTYGDFADLQALYHKRPGAWITPKGDWGRGAVTLVEIPTDSEIYDNIVCYWRPEGGLVAGSEAEFAYTLTWDQRLSDGAGLPVLNTMMGAGFNGQGTVVIIDFMGDDTVPENLSDIDIRLSASAGTNTDGVLQRNPETGGPRLAFTFEAGEATLIEFRAQLRLDGAPLSEVWLYRWTA